MENVIRHVVADGIQRHPKDVMGYNLSICDDLQLFNLEKSSTMADVLSSINSYLNTSRNRTQGLMLLHSVLKQCHTKVFQENASTWLRLLVAILQTYDPAHNLSMTCLVLCDLMKSLRHFSELSRDFQNDSLPMLITTLLAAKSEWQSEAVLCLCQCMKSYPGACGPSRNKIEQMAIGLLETDDLLLQKRACVCFALLPRTGGGGNQGIKHTEAWAAQMLRVTNSLSTNLATLYECVDLGDDLTFSSVPQDGSVRFVSPLSDTGDKRNQQLVSRYTVLTQILCQMLKLDFPAVVHVPVKKLLTFIQKSLAVTPKYLLSKPTQERTGLAAVLPSVYVNSIKMLESLINCVSSNLVPYCQAVNRCLLQLLKATDTQRRDGVNSPYSGVRCAVWECLYTWISKVGLSTGIEAVTEECVAQIRRDYRPLQDSVKLQSGAAKKLSEVSDHFHGGKRKRKSGGGNSQTSADIGVQRKLDPSADADLCCGALKALTSILQLAGPVLSPDVYKDFTQSSITILLKCSSPGILSKDIPIPYSLPRCRLSLYTAMLASVQASHPTLAPPTQYLVNVFRTGTQDRSMQVSSFCQSALLALETIIHPRAPSLNIALPPVSTDKTNNQPTNYPVVQSAENLGTSNMGLWGGDTNIEGFEGNFNEGSIRVERVKVGLHADHVDIKSSNGMGSGKDDTTRGDEDMTGTSSANFAKDSRSEGFLVSDTNEKADKVSITFGEGPIHLATDNAKGSIANEEEWFGNLEGGNKMSEDKEIRQKVEDDFGETKTATESQQKLGKRKLEDEEATGNGGEVEKKKQVLEGTSEVVLPACTEEDGYADDTEIMLQDFVNTGPDSD